MRIFDAGDGWDAKIICARPGETFVALGGEHCYPYRTPDGIEAQGFALGSGDRATVLGWKEDEAFLAEWRVERAHAGYALEEPPGAEEPIPDEVPDELILAVLAARNRPAPPA